MKKNIKYLSFIVIISLMIFYCENPSNKKKLDNNNINNNINEKESTEPITTDTNTNINGKSAETSKKPIDDKNITANNSDSQEDTSTIVTKQNTAEEADTDDEKSNQKKSDTATDTKKQSLKKKVKNIRCLNPVLLNESMYNAIQKKDYDTFLQQVQLGADINSKVLDNFTTLQFASKYGNTKIINYLIENGVEINETTIHGNALHFACESNNYEIAKILIDKNIDINLINSFGLTPFDLCSDSRIKELLIDAGYNKN